jgi:putative spermidine/putrescine transport system substrate-binding protein
VRRTHLPLVVAFAIVAAACQAGSSASPDAASAPPAATEVPASSAPAASGELTFVSWGGAYQEAQTSAWLDPFAEESGVTVLQDGPPDYSKVQAMVDAGQVTWDVVDVEGDFGLEQNAAILEPIDYTIVDAEGIDDAFATEYRVGHLFFSQVLGYNTETNGGGIPEGWDDFFDLEAFPGKRGLPMAARSGTIELALVADGVEPADLYPLDVERALAKLATIKDEIVFFETSAQVQDLLSTGEVTMALIANGRADAAKKEGQPVAVQWSGQVLQAGYLVVPKGAPNKQAAMELIAFIVGAEHNGKLSEFITYAPTNANATPAEAAVPDLPSTHLDGSQIVFNDLYWIENYETVNNRFQQWKQE